MNVKILRFLCLILTASFACRSAPTSTVLINISFPNVAEKEIDYIVNNEIIQTMKNEIPNESQVTTISSDGEAKIFIAQNEIYGAEFLHKVEDLLHAGKSSHHDEFKFGKIRLLRRGEKIPHPEIVYRKRTEIVLDAKRLGYFGLTANEVHRALKGKKLTSNVLHTEIKIGKKVIHIGQIAGVREVEYPDHIVRSYMLAEHPGAFHP